MFVLGWEVFHGVGEGVAQAADELEEGEVYVAEAGAQDVAGAFRIVGENAVEVGAVFGEAVGQEVAGLARAAAFWSS